MNDYIENHDEYTVTVKDDVLKIYWKDPSRELLGEFINDEYEIHELYEAVRKIRAGELERYGLCKDWYSFIVNQDGIVISPGGEACYAGVSFHSENSLDELEEMLNLYCDYFYKLSGGTDLRIADVD